MNTLAFLSSNARSVLPCIALLIGLSACASQRMESPGSAWELVNEQEVVGARSKGEAPASNKVVHTRQAVSLHPQGMELASTPEEDTTPLSRRSMDERSPTGWTRQALLANWGVPTLVSGDSWQYRSRDGTRCVSLSVVNGVVTNSRPTCG